jgi:hypothetical protein
MILLWLFVWYIPPYLPMVPCCCEWPSANLCAVARYGRWANIWVAAVCMNLPGTPWCILLILMFSYLFTWVAYLTICYVPQHQCQTIGQLLNLHNVEVSLYFKYEPQIFFTRLIFVWIHVTSFCYAGSASSPCLSIIPYLISMGQWLMSKMSLIQSCW